ncbi:MAG: glycosyltransferase family 9 protein, partial [Proteobacteria bacterium]|nr:glycosyltransferase family 9 protein [Pseudomonadota bacterium]
LGNRRSRRDRPEIPRALLEGPLVLLNPNAGDLLPLRRWPTERFIELGRQLLADHPSLTIGITGAPSEQEAAQAIAATIGAPPRVISLAGRTTLREVVVLYTLADVLVTNDSGPGHFASLTDIHDIVLFGPETPRLFGPVSPNSRVVWAKTACSPCVSVLNHRFSPCTDNVCMQAIAVDEVRRVVEECLEER